MVDCLGNYSPNWSAGSAGKSGRWGGWVVGAHWAVGSEARRQSGRTKPVRPLSVKSRSSLPRHRETICLLLFGLYHAWSLFHHLFGQVVWMDGWIFFWSRLIASTARTVET